MFVDVLALLACLIPVSFPISMFVGSLGELLPADRSHTKGDGVGVHGIPGISGPDVLISQS